MIHFIKNTVVGVWLENKIIAVIDESSLNHNEAIKDAVVDEMGCENCEILYNWTFTPGIGEEKADLKVQITDYDPQLNQTLDIELTCITKY